MNLLTQPATTIERLACEDSCPPLLDAEKKYVDGLNSGSFDRAGYNRTSRELLRESDNELGECWRRAEKCLGAVVVDGEIKCGSRVPASGTIHVTLPFEGSK